MRELFQALWKEKKLIILITAIVSISSIVYALQITKYYQSETIMSVRNNAENQGMLSQLSGAASLLGVNLATSGDDKSMQSHTINSVQKVCKTLANF